MCFISQCGASPCCLPSGQRRCRVLLEHLLSLDWAQAGKPCTGAALLILPLAAPSTLKMLLASRMVMFSSEVPSDSIAADYANVFKMRPFARGLMRFLFTGAVVGLTRSLWSATGLILATAAALLLPTVCSVAGVLPF